MPLINCKLELIFKWTKCFILSATGTDNDDVKYDIIFDVNNTKLYVPVVTLSGKDNQKPSKLLGQGLERSVYWNECITKSESENTTNSYRYFLESNFVGFNRFLILLYSNQDANAQRYKAKSKHLPKGIIRGYNVIMNGKILYDRPVDSKVKRYEEI